MPTDPRLANPFGLLGLISPVHFTTFHARLDQVDLTAAFAMRAVASADNDDDDDDDGDEPCQSPLPAWTKFYNIWGQRLPSPEKSGSTAIIPIRGAITSGLPALYRVFEYADTDEIAGWISAALDDDEVDRILLKVDSPGGMVTGTPELAAVVADAAQAKRVDAHTKGMMCSAAYYVASQADNVWCTPSSDVGCIGVYTMLYDFTGWLEKFGVKATMIKSGDLKGTGHEDVTASPEQLAEVQRQIDLIGAQFRGTVKSRRALVQDDSMRGQSFMGIEAVDRGLAAGLRTFESLL